MNIRHPEAAAPLSYESETSRSGSKNRCLRSASSSAGSKLLRKREKSKKTAASSDRHKDSVIRYPSTRIRMYAHARGTIDSSRRSIYAYICTFVKPILFLSLLPPHLSCTDSQCKPSQASQQVKYQQEKKRKQERKESKMNIPAIP